MEPERPSEGHEPVRKLLREWRVITPLPSEFQEGVWHRIERAQAAKPLVPSVGAAIAHWIGTALLRPALATSYVAVLLAIGVMAGWAQARQETTRIKDELGHRYVRALDPFLIPHDIP
jgi:hypothetical protein